MADTGVTPYPAKLNSPQTEAFNTRLLTTLILSHCGTGSRAHQKSKNEMKPKTRLSCPPCSSPFLLFLLSRLCPASLVFMNSGSVAPNHVPLRRSMQISCPIFLHLLFLFPLAPPLSPSLRIFRICLRNKFAYFSVCVCVCPVWLPAAHHFLSEQDGPRMPASS